MYFGFVIGKYPSVELDPWCPEIPRVSPPESVREESEQTVQPILVAIDHSMVNSRHQSLFILLLFPLLNESKVEGGILFNAYTLIISAFVHPLPYIVLSCLFWVVYFQRQVGHYSAPVEETLNGLSGLQQMIITNVSHLMITNVFNLMFTNMFHLLFVHLPELVQVSVGVHHENVSTGICVLPGLVASERVSVDLRVGHQDIKQRHKSLVKSSEGDLSTFAYMAVFRSSDWYTFTSQLVSIMHILSVEHLLSDIHTTSHFNHCGRGSVNIDSGISCLTSCSSFIKGGLVIPMCNSHVMQSKVS